MIFEEQLPKNRETFDKSFNYPDSNACDRDRYRSAYSIKGIL